MTAIEEVAAQAVEVALRFASTEPYGDLAMNARRAAVIAVQALIIAGWTPPSLPTENGEDPDVHL